MSERYDESNNMNPTVETIAHRHRIGPPRWGFGSFRGPLPRPMAWDDIGLSRCDVGAPVNDTRAGFGSGTQFHPIIGGGRRSRTLAPPHDTTPSHAQHHAYGIHNAERHNRATPRSNNYRNQTGNDIDQPHRTNIDTRQTRTTDKQPRRTTTDPRQTRTAPDNSETPNGVVRCQPRPSAWVRDPTTRNVTPTGWPEIRDRQQKPITTNDRRPNDTMNPTT